MFSLLQQQLLESYSNLMLISSLCLNIWLFLFSNLLLQAFVNHAWVNLLDVNLLGTYLVWRRLMVLLNPRHRLFVGVWTVFFWISMPMWVAISALNCPMSVFFQLYIFSVGFVSEVMYDIVYHYEWYWYGLQNLVLIFIFLEGMVDLPTRDQECY